MSYLNGAKKVKPYIEKAVQSLPDADALVVKTMYPAWMPNVAYEEGYRIYHDDDLYRVRQAHTSLANYPPSTDTASLYTRIDEAHTGTIDDPIPYYGNMALESGKYYSQNGVIYYCNRSTEIPVYNTLADLVGLYVEVAL